ncbi:MAG: glutamine synthetase beta-grasp domain-containing protein, partial [Pseudomonadota bacterium]
MSDADAVIRMIKEKDIDWVDLRFTDPRGKWQHLTMDAEVVDEDMFEDGVMFDGSSIAGWKAINESDMILALDPSSVTMDPFTAQPTIILFCSIKDPGTGELYSRCPRATAERAQAYLNYTGIGDTAYFGPEPEFFVFDDVKYKVGYNGAMYLIDDEEGPYNSDKTFEEGNSGHRPRVKGGYCPVPPVDSAHDMRGEMVTTMKRMGLGMDKHHHEVGASQHELGMTFSTLLETADRVQIYKYVTQMVAHSYGKTATFMPK